MLNKDANMHIKPVALDDLKEVENRLDTILGNVAKSFFLISESNLPHYITLRSSAVTVTTVDRFDDNDYFSTPLKFTFFVDLVKKHELTISKISDFVCLGRITTIKGIVVDGKLQKDTKKWECVSRKIHNIDDPVSGKMYTNLFEYDIMGPGTYAVIFLPKMTPNLIPTAFCGLICKYKKEVIVFSFFVLPIGFLILGVIFKYMML